MNETVNLRALLGLIPELIRAVDQMTNEVDSGVNAEFGCPTPLLYDGPPLEGVLGNVEGIVVFKDSFMAVCLARKHLRDLGVGDIVGPSVRDCAREVMDAKTLQAAQAWARKILETT